MKYFISRINPIVGYGQKVKDPEFLESRTAECDFVKSHYGVQLFYEVEKPVHVWCARVGYYN
jgi:hypothetical protein